MGSSFKLIKVIAIIAVILILITMGVFVFTNTDIFVKGSSDKLSLTDTNEFNNMWSIYKGKQDGSKIKAMADRLIVNAKENENNPTMLPDVFYQATDGAEPIHIKSNVKGRDKKNIEGFEQLKNDVTSRHSYWVKFVYSEKTKVISGIIVQYEQGDNLEFTPDEN